MRDDTKRGFKGNYEKVKKQKQNAMQTVGIVLRMEHNTALKFYKTRLKKQLELDYIGVQIYFYTTQRPALQA